MEMTIRQIAERGPFAETYIRARLQFEKGFPKPTRLIGRAKLYDPQEVAAFLRRRKKRAPYRRHAA